MVKSKIPGGFVFIVLFALFLISVVSGFFDFSVARQGENWNSATSEDLIAQFRLKAPPVFSFDLHDLPQFDPTADLIDPGSLLPQTAKYKLNEIAALSTYARNCKWEQKLESLDRRLSKAVIWHKFLCGLQTTLPYDFFSQSPWIHPGGHTFVALAVQSGNANFLRDDWIEQNLRWAHISELPKLKKTLDVNGRFMGKLDVNELKKIAEKRRFIESNERVFLRNNAKDFQYSVYARARWDDFLKKEHLLFFSEPQADCLLIDGVACWKVDRISLSSTQEQYRRIFASSTSLLLLGLIGFSISSLRGRQQLAQEQKLMLQTLAHELRTPVSTMGFSLESIRSQFYDFEPVTQKAFIELCDDVERLKQLIDASTQYLRSRESGKAFASMPRFFDSFNTLIETILEPYLEKVNFVPLKDDVTIMTDPYWLQVCLRNLVNNALNHGVPPVSVGLRATAERVIVIVRDQGQIDKNAIVSFGRPFQKSPKSKGLGLGLSITKSIIKILGGTFKVQATPSTTFSIELQRGERQ